MMVLITVFSVLIIFNNLSASRMLLARVYANTRSTVRDYADRLESSLENLDNWIYTITANDRDLNLLRMEQFESPSWHTAVYRLQLTFSNMLTANEASALFCYVPREDYYLISGSGITHAEVKDLLISKYTSETISAQWTVCENVGVYYLVRGYTVRGITVGAVTRLSDFLSVTSEIDLRLLTTDGTLIARDASLDSLTPPENDTQPGYKKETLNCGRSLIVYVPMTYCRQYLAQVIPYHTVSTESRSFSGVIIILASGIILVLVLIFFFLKDNVLRPVNSITRGINDLKTGNLDAHIRASHFPEEFDNVAQNFNDTVSQIKNLKIDIYERELKTRNLELQYVKQQITPHFMINCLNTAYQLTDSNRPELAKEMLSNLSSHLRYTLSSGQTVRLGNEIDFVNNYVKISEIRYPGSLKLSISCPPGLKNAQVVPLMLLNFVENSIKHEIRMGHLLTIDISVALEDGRLHIIIRDTGRGFPQDSLDYLNHIDPEDFSDSTHLGVSNVVIRMKHLYPDAAFSFSNTPEDHGAVVDILLPFEEITGESGHA